MKPRPKGQGISQPMSLIRLYELVWKFEPIEIPVFLEEK